MGQALLKHVGKKYNRLRVIGISDRMDSEGKKTYLNCRCRCGVEKDLWWWNVVKGNTKSCGCLKKEKSYAYLLSIEGVKAHTMPERYVWGSMIDRCCNPKRKDYPRYGGRGIQVCHRWKHSFVDFYGDVGARPTPQHTLERVNRKGNYEPSNCVWATRKEQARNRDNNTLITYKGQTKTMAEWAELTGVGSGLIRWRLDAGWSVTKALSEKVRGTGKYTRYDITYQGHTRTLPEWARITGVGECTLRARIDAGWPIAKALGQKTRKWVRK